jgi:hypothetical protein
MQSETKTHSINSVQACQNCKKDFTIESDDFGFYEKMGVVPPDMCPDCRAQLRLSFRNEKSFYKRKCDKCQKDVVSMYSPNKVCPVWCYDCWFADDWDPKDFALEYDSSKSMFTQWKELFDVVPKPALMSVQSVNSEYSNFAGGNKDCYMLIIGSNNESCINCYWIQVSKDLVDCSFTQKVERSYEVDDCYDSYGLQYCKGAHSCFDSYFLLNCRGCSDCIGCINLRQQKYNIFNEQYSKEKYEEKLKSFNLDTHSGVESLRAQFEVFIKNQPRKYAEVYNTTKSTGNYMTNVNNVTKSFHAYDSENCKYCIHAFRNAKDCMDSDAVGRTAENIYNSMNATIEASNIICGSVCYGSQFTIYCFNCLNCENCLACSGLRKQKYCILNKQYSKEEYEKLKSEIVAKMKAEGTFGNFFARELSDFGYNESSAMLEFPLTREQALEQGFKWEDTPRGTYGKETKKAEELPDSIKDVDFDVTKEVYACKNCNKNYRIIPNEFTFYQNNAIPLPRLCPDCRHSRRIEARGPNKLWTRSCMCEIANHEHQEKCQIEFETSYAPDRPEIIYCEKCYQQEVV